MDKYTYAVVDVDGHVLAKGMELEIAIIMLRALMDKWCHERGLVLSLQRVYDEPCSGVDANAYYEDHC